MLIIGLVINIGSRKLRAGIFNVRTRPEHFVSELFYGMARKSNLVLEVCYLGAKPLGNHSGLLNYVMIFNINIYIYMYGYMYIYIYIYIYLKASPLPPAPLALLKCVLARW